MMVKQEVELRDGEKQLPFSDFHYFLFYFFFFTGPGTFTVCSVGNPIGSDTVSYMVIAGGGGGSAGAGGAGGYREGRTPQCNTWTASPIACFPVTICRSNCTKY